MVKPAEVADGGSSVQGTTTLAASSQNTFIGYSAGLKHSSDCIGIGPSARVNPTYDEAISEVDGFLEKGDTWDT